MWSVARSGQSGWWNGWIVLWGQAGAVATRQPTSPLLLLAVIVVYNRDQSPGREKATGK